MDKYTVALTGINIMIANTEAAKKKAASDLREINKKYADLVEKRTKLLQMNKRPRASFDVTVDDGEVVTAEEPAAPQTFVEQKKRQKRSVKEPHVDDWPEETPPYSGVLGGKCVWCFNTEAECKCECHWCHGTRDVCKFRCPGFVPDSLIGNCFNECVKTKNMHEFRKRLRDFHADKTDEFQKLVLEHYQTDSEHSDEKIRVCALCYCPYKAQTGRFGFCNACRCCKTIKDVFASAQVVKRRRKTKN